MTKLPKHYRQYRGPHGLRWRYLVQYRNTQLRKRGFTTRAEAERALRAEMRATDIALASGSVAALKPTTLQDALDLYARKQDLRAREKGGRFAYASTSTVNQLQKFADDFGADRPLRDITEPDLNSYYHRLCEQVEQSTACTRLSRLAGVLSYAQRNKPDLMNWLKPTLQLKRRASYTARAIEADEYAKLVEALLNPRPVNRTVDVRHRALYREAADAVRLLRGTGCRLNEVLRLKMTQVNFDRREILIFASKTESVRTLPMSGMVEAVIRARVSEWLTSNLLFARATATSFDVSIIRAVEGASREAGLNYGRKSGGFSLHSLRHAYISELLTKTGGDIATVKALSGHASLSALGGYAHPSGAGLARARDIIEGL